MSDWIPQHAQRPAARSIDIVELTEAYLAEKRFEGVRDYILRGRRFADLTPEALNGQWVEVYRAACTLEDDRSWDELMDLQREFDLRAEEPPMHLLAVELEVLKQSFERWLRESRWNPETCEQARAEITDLYERLRRPKN
jgi:hypothetical protein